MSEEEFSKLTSGCDIVGRRAFQARTNSSGICFMRETVTVRGVVLHPEDYLAFLSGIVTDDVMVEFECKCAVNDTWGVYADPLSDAGWYDTFACDEVCVPVYNRETMVPLRYYIPGRWGKEGTWYTVN